MDQPEFKPRDRVRVISGGPEMTVQEVAGTVVTCAWMDGNDLITKGIPAVLLDKIEYDNGIL